MKEFSRPTRILLLETEYNQLTPVQSLLQSKENLKKFHAISVFHLSEAFREMDNAPPDLILMDLDPDSDPECVALTRLHQYAPKAPIIVLLPDDYHGRALTVLEKGADDYLLTSQIHSETLPAFFQRARHRFASHKAVRESEERFRLMVEHASDVILILDHAGVIKYAGPSTKQVLNHSSEMMTGQNILDFIHRDDRLIFLDSFEKTFTAGHSLSFVQFRFRQSEGRWIHMEGKGRVVPDGTGQPVCILNSHDVTHRVKLEEELRSLSLRDELTGLHNRRSFVACFEQQLKLANRTNKTGLSLLFIDLDGFKQINDTLGHKEGDHALVEASNLLKSTFRDADVIARLGGDEFVVFLTDYVEDTHVDTLKKRLSDGLEAWNGVANRRYRLAMSVGVIHYNPKERRTPEELLSHADELMYQQKRERKALQGVR